MSSFDGVADTFVDYYETTRGHVREVLTQENLSEFLEPSPLNILDVGGGDGRDAAWLARLGHAVTMVEPAAGMLEKARARFKREAVDVALYKALAEEVVDVLPQRHFDVVLSHGVLMYQIDDPEGHLEVLAMMAKPGGILSILTKGFSGALDRFLRKHDTPAALDLMATERCINNLGLPVWAYKPESVQALLGSQALTLLTWRGVRVASDGDGRLVKDIPKAELETLLAAERTLGTNESTRGMGQMLHFIARQLGH